VLSSAVLSALLLFLLFALAFAQGEQTVTVVTNARLRSGPGTTYSVVGGAKAGVTLTVVGPNTAGDWYELENGAWIAAFLVKPAPAQAAAVQAAGPPEGSQAATVTNIVDGDTIDVAINGQTYRVRYILVNTPERGQPLYAEATEANRKLVGGKTVYLVKDVNETDRYGRLLRYLYLTDGTFVNAELVCQGFAQLATFPPDVAKEAEIRAARQEAVNAGRGLWADEAQTGQASSGGATVAATATPVPTTLPAPAPATPVPTAPPPSAPASGSPACDPAYPTICIPPNVPDLDCKDIPQYGRFSVLPPDPHGFDGNDNDGLGCESNEPVWSALPMQHRCRCSAALHGHQGQGSFMENRVGVLSVAQRLTSWWLGASILG
jgi:endonuclease YncB( thermonuclease family)